MHKDGNSPSCRPKLIFILLPTMGLLVSCTEYGNDPRWFQHSVPPDFALQLQVSGHAGTEDPLRRSSLYVLEPNRRLRMAIGSDADKTSFPTVIQILSPSAFEAIFRFVETQHLLAEPTSPVADQAMIDRASHEVIYHVEIYTHSRLHRYATTPTESPPTVQLLAKLIELTVKASR